MSEPKIFVLQKDLPDAKAGQIFFLSESGHYYASNAFAPINGWLREHVENNSEWFLPLEETEIIKAKELLSSKGFCVVDSKVYLGLVGDSLKNRHLIYGSEDIIKAFTMGHYSAVCEERQHFPEVIPYYNGPDVYLASLKEEKQ